MHIFKQLWLQFLKEKSMYLLKFSKVLANTSSAAKV